MKRISIEKTTLDIVVENAQNARIVLTRDGKPVALLIGVEGLDAEQMELGSSDVFWKLIAERRGQKTLTRAQLEQRLDSAS